MRKVINVPTELLKQLKHEAVDNEMPVNKYIVRLLTERNGANELDQIS